MICATGCAPRRRQLVVSPGCSERSTGGIYTAIREYSPKLRKQTLPPETNLLPKCLIKVSLGGQCCYLPRP